MARAAEHALRACLVLVFASFVAHLVGNLGRVPLYGDVRSSAARAPEFSLADGVVRGPSDVPGWVAMAEAGTSDLRRGPLYAPFLRVVHDHVGGPWRAGLDANAKVEERAFVPWHAAVQVVQLALFGLAVFALGRALRLRGTGAQLLWWGVVLDPLLVHAQFSLMPDGLALSAVALACAACVVHARTGSLFAIAAFAVAVAAAAALRPEKGLVFATAALAAVAATWCATAKLPRQRSRVAWQFGAAALAALASAGVARTLLDPEARAGWTVFEIAVHSRIAFPRLEELAPHLPKEWRERLPRESVLRYDADLGDARRLVDFLTEGDSQRRAELTHVFFVAAREHAALEVVTAALIDVPENLCPLGAGVVAFGSGHVAGDERALLEPHKSGAVAWSLYMQPSPLASGAALAALFCVVVAGAAATCWRSVRQRCAALIPSTHFAVFAGVFLIANAAVFAATQDLKDLRYGLPAHFALVGFVWCAIGARLPIQLAERDASAPSALAP